MIKGVKITKIKSYNDNRGFFREILKQKDKYTNVNFKQISHSFIKKNITKGWHLHKKQYQWNYLVTGKINVWLFDTRKKSKTYKKSLKINIDSKKDKILYFFPPGVAHGYKSISKINHIIYGTSGYYDKAEEKKLDLNSDLIPNYFKNSEKKK